MGRKLGLTRDDVIAAATAIADASGIDAVTPTVVAERLGIRPPSLYAHVDGLAALRRLLALRGAEAMAAAFREAMEGHRGLEAVKEVALAYRRFARRHPGLYAALPRAVRPGEDDEMYAALAEVALLPMRALGEAGVPADDRVHLTRAIRSALHGFVVLERDGGFGMPESVDESYLRMVELLVSAVRASRGAREEHGTRTPPDRRSGGG